LAAPLRYTASLTALPRCAEGRDTREFVVNNTNTESLPGYTTVDLKLRIPLGRTVVFNGSLDNLLDEQYEEFPGFPAVGRSFRVGIGTAFIGD
jgi:vitamin B12 transporter